MNTYQQKATDDALLSALNDAQHAMTKELETCDQISIDEILRRGRLNMIRAVLETNYSANAS